MNEFGSESHSYRVIDYLKSKKVLDKYVIVSATSQFMETDDPYNLLDYESSSRYHSKDLPDQSIRIDFSISPIYIEKFILFNENNRDPYYWVLEGSQNRRDFSVIFPNNGVPMCQHGKFDGYTLGCVSRSRKEYNISQKGYYNSLRLRQTGNDPNGEPYLVLTGIEFIGTIQIKKCTINFVKHRNNYMHFVIFCLLHI